MLRRILEALLGAVVVASVPSPVLATEPRTAAPPACVGDCDGDSVVRINELLTGVNIALGVADASACVAFDCPELPGGAIINCAVQAVANALSDCATAELPTPYPLSTLEESCGRETGAALLAGVRPAYAATLAPRLETGWPGAVPFTVRLTYTDGAITCYPRYVPPPWSARPEIDERVGLVVEVAFDTADGRFAERVEAELKGGSRGGNLSFSRRPEEIQGTYRPDLPGYEDVRVGMWGNFWGDWTNGGVHQTGLPPGRVSIYIPLAYWQPRGDPPPRPGTGS